MMTFCFINVASRYRDSPVKQRAVHKDKIVDGHAHYTLKANHRLLAVGMRKSPGTLVVSEAQIILRILLSVVDDVAVVAE